MNEKICSLKNRDYILPYDIPLKNLDYILPYDILLKNWDYILLYAISLNHLKDIVFLTDNKFHSHLKRKKKIDYSWLWKKG